MDMGRWLHAFRARSTRLTRSQNQGQSFVFQMDSNKTEIGRQREEGGYQHERSSQQGHKAGILNAFLLPYERLVSPHKVRMRQLSNIKNTLSRLVWCYNKKIYKKCMLSKGGSEMPPALMAVEVFCSYSHKDKIWLSKLEAHLSLLQRQGLISLWHDRLISPGTDWAKALDTHLEKASVILLLVSADFIASDYCYGIEMKRALERQEAGEARVIPILVRPADWKSAPFASLQVLPGDAKPIATRRNKDTALASVAAGLRRVIEDLPLFAASAPRVNLPAVWNIPYSRNPFFLGRNNELTQLRSHLHAGQATALSQPQAISGLGGIGKTQLALEYAYRYHQDYKAVFWARAESTEALISSYIAFAELLRLPDREAKKQDIIVQAVKTWLQIHHEWLLILDNADDLALLPDFLPPSLGGHLLMTTRAAATGRLAQRLEIETLLPEQGALFLLRRAALLAPDAPFENISQKEQEQALQISRELGGLPLALDQAGAYMEETGTNLASYWQIYQHHRTDLLQQHRGLVTDHPDSVARTLILSFQRVEAKNPAAAELLRLCAYLAPDAIPEEILTANSSLLGPMLASVAADAFLLGQVTEALRALSLIRRDPSEKTLSIHRLVQVVLQDAQKQEERRLWEERAVLAVNAAFPHPRPDTWPRCERLLPHALLVSQYIEKNQITSEEAGHLLYEVASYLSDRARYQEAEPLFLEALSIQEQWLGSEHLDVATLLNGLATLYKEQGKFAEAEQFYQRALPIFKKQLGSESLEVARVLHNLATISHHQGKFAEAEQFYQRALPIFEKQLGPEHPTALTNLAELYREQGKFAEAEQFHRRALSIWEQLEPEHPNAANTLGALATLYKDQGKYIEAESLYQRARRIWEQQLGPDHPRTAIAFYGLAELYQMEGKYEEAEVFYQRVMPIWKQQLGLNNPYVGALFNNLADLSRDQGKYIEAETLYQHAQHIFEQQLEPEHPYMAALLHGTAELFYRQKKYEEAESLYQRALHIREQVLGNQHPDTAETMYALAQLWVVQGNREEARDWYARTLVVREQAFGAHHPKTTETRSRLISLFHAIGQHEEAAQLEAVQAEQGISEEEPSASPEE